MEVSVQKIGKFQSLKIKGDSELSLLWEFLECSLLDLYLVNDLKAQIKKYLDSNSTSFYWGGNSGELVLDGNVVKIEPTYNEQLFVELPLHEFLAYIEKLRSYLDEFKEISR